MDRLDFVSKSSTKGIFFSLIFLFSIVAIAIPSDAYAEEIDVKSIALEETTIIELTNDMNKDVNTFRIWVGSDFSFKSFKTEKGWVGEKTPQGVIIFTSSEPIKKGESVKFGVKTDKVNSGINWKALDKNDKQIDTGKVLSKELTTIIQNPKPTQEQTPENTRESISSESIFRIIPEKPNVGSSIRVTGDKFGASQEFDFFIDSKKLGSFETDKDGHFITTMKIPDDEKADRVDFKVKDKEGKEKSISLRIGEIDNQIPESDNIKLSIEGIPSIMHRGDFLEISGTAQPGSGITAQITNPDGDIINTRTSEVDRVGNWKLDEPIIVPLDTPFGKYSVTISDGRDQILKRWTVESNKKIIIAPTSLKFDPGEIMKFNGTALPNKPIELVLEDPLGKEIFSNIINTDESGFIEFEFPTTQSSSEGTYTLIASQEKDKEFIFVGLGQLPTIPVNLEFDKLNYKEGETAIISLTGKSSDVISLLIVDPSDKPKGDTISITLEPDGRGTYSLNLEGYASGVYTAVISKGSAQSTEIFTVGLQTGSGEIEINTTKVEYQPGDSVLILGDTGPNVLLTISMTDPNQNQIKTKETFSDKNGKVSEDSFRIPSDGMPGVWMINAKSGANFDTIEIEVLATVSEGMMVSVTDGEDSYLGKSIIIEVFGASQTVSIEIVSADGEIIENLSIPASGSGGINLPWFIPDETAPGTYTIKVTDAFDSAETTFEIQ